MRLDQPLQVNNQDSARQLLQNLSDHYTRTGGAGRILFSRNDQGEITGTDRSRGVWARLSTITSSAYSDAKAEFNDMVRLAYPEHAQLILSHLANRQMETGVTDMLTPGMIKGAIAKARELEALGWPSGQGVSTSLTAPNGNDPGLRDVSLAVGLIKDGRKPELFLENNPRNDGPLKMMQQSQFDDARNFAACHDTAVQLQELMGKPGTERTGGGAGIEARRQALTLAIESLTSGTPCIIHLKATGGPDGHSFSLVGRPDGRVDVLEAWASSHAEADLGTILQQCKTGLSKSSVIRALERIGSSDPDVRTQGYTALSTAYDSSVRYELVRDPKKDERGYEIEDVEDLRAPDDRIKLEVTVRDLRPRQEVMDKMDTRLGLLQEFRNDLQLTEPEQRAYNSELARLQQRDQQQREQEQV